MSAGPYPTKPMFEALKGRVTGLEIASPGGGSVSSPQVDYAGAGIQVTRGAAVRAGNLTEFRVALPANLSRGFEPFAYDGLWVGAELQGSDIASVETSEGVEFDAQPWAGGTLLLFSSPVKSIWREDAVIVTLTAPKMGLARPASQAEMTLLSGQTTFTFDPPLDVPCVLPVALVRTSWHFAPGPDPLAPPLAPHLGDVWVAGVKLGALTQGVDTWAQVYFNADRAGEWFDTIVLASPNNYRPPVVKMYRPAPDPNSEAVGITCTLASAVHDAEVGRWRITLAQPERIEQGVLLQVDFNVSMNMVYSGGEAVGVAPAYEGAPMPLLWLERSGVPGKLPAGAMNTSAAPGTLQKGDFEIVDGGSAPPRLRYRSASGAVYTLPMTPE